MIEGKDSGAPQPAFVAGPGAVSEHVGGIHIALACSCPGLTELIAILTGGVRGGARTFVRATLSHIHGKQHPGLAMARDFAGEDDAALISRLDRVTHRGRSTEVGSAGQVVTAVGRGDVNIVDPPPREHEGIPDVCRNGGQPLGTGEDEVDGDLLGRGRNTVKIRGGKSIADLVANPGIVLSDERVRNLTCLWEGFSGLRSLPAF